jgi:hypothetical protein
LFNINTPPLFTVFESPMTDVAQRLPLSKSSCLSFLPPPLSFVRTNAPEDSNWKKRYDVLLRDYEHVHKLYIEEQRLRANERRTFVAEVSRRETAEVHAALARHEIERLQFQANAKEERKRQGPSEKIWATGLLTVGEGLAIRNTQRHARNDKVSAEESKQVEAELRKVTDTERRQALLHSTEVFDGKLSSKKRSDWQDIAFTLGLLIEAKNADLILSIHEHLKDCPILRSGRFALVWDSLSKKIDRQAATKDDIESTFSQARVI